MKRYILLGSILVGGLVAIAFSLLRSNGADDRSASTPDLATGSPGAEDLDARAVGGQGSPDGPSKSAGPIVPPAPRRSTELGGSVRTGPGSEARKFAMDVKVVDDDLENPIAGAEVRVRGSGDEPSPGADRPGAIEMRLSTDREGRVRFERLPHATVEVEVVAAGFAPVRREIGVGSYDRIETIRMSAKGSVVGRAVDAGDHPIEGVLVTLLLQGESAAASADRVAESDAAGRFEIRGIDLKGEAAVNGRLVASHPDYADRPERSLAVLRASEVRSPDLVLSKMNPLLRGRVLTSESVPLSGITVHIAGAFGEREAATDKAGRFAVRVVPGAVSLEIEDRCLRNAGYFEALSVAEDRDLDVGDVLVDKPVLVLSGIVRFDDDSKGRGVQLALGRVTTVTDPDGLFRLELCDVPGASGSGLVANWTNRDGQAWTQDLPRPAFDSNDLELVLSEHGLVVEAREDGRALDERTAMTVKWRVDAVSLDGKDSGPAFGTPLKLSRSLRGKLRGTIEIAGFRVETFEHELVAGDFEAATTITVAVRRL